MEPNDEVCLCFHVRRRKLENYLRVERPQRASQLSDCGGAGTGCGWCVPILEKLFDHFQNPSLAVELPSPEQHASDRQDYLKRE